MIKIIAIIGVALLLGGGVAAVIVMVAIGSGLAAFYLLRRSVFAGVVTGEAVLLIGATLAE